MLFFQYDYVLISYKVMTLAVGSWLSVFSPCIKSCLTQN